MSDTERWVGTSPPLSQPHSVTDDRAAGLVGVRQRVSADSFKSLITRLNKGAIQQSIVINPAPPVIPEPLPPMRPAIIEAPVPPAPINDNVPDGAASSIAAIEAAEALPDPVVNIEPAPSVEIDFADAFAPLPLGGVEPPPILPAPELVKPTAVQVQTPQPEANTFVRRVRSAEDVELETIMRMIAAVPTNDERLAFLDEAAELISRDELQSRPKGDLAQIEERFLQSVQSGVLNPVRSVELDNPVNHAAYSEPAATPVESYLEPADPVATEVAADVSATDVVIDEPTPEPRAPQQFSNLDGQEAGELARSLLDMMAAGAGNSQPHERALAADTLLRLVPRLALKPLVLLADRLSMMDQPPPLLVARLIRDERIGVSGPLLENSNNVTDADLVRVITEGTPEQRRVIARRRKLSRLIGDKLIASGEAPVLLTLVRNANAEISHDGFLDLLQATKRDQDLMAPLCTRADLPAPFAFELFWIAPVQLRRYILNRFLTDSETLTKILKITMVAQGNGEIGIDKGFPPPEMVEKGIEFFATGDTLACGEHFAALLMVDPMTVARVMSDRLGDPLAIMLKAAGVPRTDFASHLGRLRSSDYAVLDLNRDPEELHALFDQMSFNKARILLTYWDWATRRSGPYAPVH